MRQQTPPANRPVPRIGKFFSFGGLLLFGGVGGRSESPGYSDSLVTRISGARATCPSWSGDSRAPLEAGSLQVEREGGGESQYA